MENRIFWILVVVLALGAVAFLFAPQVEEQLAPELVAAHVAVEIAGDPVAEVGPRQIEAGDRFTLRAVLEARDGDGPLYYTEAERLVIDGEEIAAERLRPWSRSRTVKVRWFTVEGRLPWLEVADESLEGFRYQEFLRSDWPLAWSVPGELDSAFDDHLEPNPHLEGKRNFGTQRYHVRVELYRLSDDLVPERTFRSWGVDELRERSERFPRVTAVVPGAEVASTVFGLPQLEPADDAAVVDEAVADPAADDEAAENAAEDSSELRRRLEELWEHRIAWNRLILLRDIARDGGTRFADLAWRDLDLEAGETWGEAARTGDLLRVGDRVVVLFEDRGEPGLVDGGDLAFDFVQGAEVRALAEIFGGGEETGTVQVSRPGPA